MATKEEWREYFELTQGRKPTLEEFQAALRNGDISSDVNKGSQQKTKDGKTNEKAGSVKYLKWLIPVGVVVVCVIGLTAFAANYYSQSNQISRLTSYIGSGNTEKLLKNLTTSEKSFKVSSANDKEFLTYINQNRSQIISALTSEGKSGQLSIAKTGHNFLIFPRYSVQVNLTNLKATVENKDTQVEIGNIKTTATTKDNQEVAIGSFLPGTYTMKILGKLYGQKMEINQTVTTTSGTNQTIPVALVDKNVSGALTLWVDTEQDSEYNELVSNFRQDYPNVTVNVEISPTGSANARTDVAKDPNAAADVFEVPEDQLGEMAENKTINPLSSVNSAIVKGTNVPQSIQAVTYKGKIYAYPFGEQSNVLYYDKSKLSATDVKTWETLTAKGKVGLDFSMAYDVYPMFFTNGTYLYGKSGEDIHGTTADSTAGSQVLSWIGEQKSNQNVNGGTNSFSLLKDGKIVALFDGPWDDASVHKVLGTNYAVTPYPTVNIGGKSKQMSSFLGVETFAVNASSKDQAAANALAGYLTNENAQLESYKDDPIYIPTNLEAQKDALVKNDPLAQAVLQQAKSATVMPKLPEMAIFWNDATTLIPDTYNGKIKPADYSSTLKNFVNQISQGD